MDNNNSNRVAVAKRPRFNFWLDLSKNIDYEISQLIAQLKENRLFTQTIRDGIRLICDLRAGKLDVLFELFPWVRAEFLKYMEDLQAKPVVAAPTFAPDVEKYLQEILEKLDKPAAPEPSIMKPMNNGLKQIGGLKSIAAARYDEDDDDLLVVQSAKGDGSATQNFLKAMRALQH